MGQGGRAEPRLTPAGHAFLDLRTEMLGAFGRTMPLVKEPGHKMEGRVTVRTPRNEYSFPFIDFLFEFRKENPSIAVAVLPWSPTDGVDDVLSGDVNLAYIGHRPRRASLARPYRHSTRAQGRPRRRHGRRPPRPCQREVAQRLVREELGRIVTLRVSEQLSAACNELLSDGVLSEHPLVYLKLS